MHISCQEEQNAHTCMHENTSTRGWPKQFSTVYEERRRKNVNSEAPSDKRRGKQNFPRRVDLTR